MIKEGSGTYTILYSTSIVSILFYQLLNLHRLRPKIVNPYISALIGAALLHPDLIGLMGDVGNGATAILWYSNCLNCHPTVLPIIITIWAYSFLYKF